MEINNLIIGCGPTGIGAALGLRDEYHVIDGSNTPGGYSRSIKIEHAVFDYGGHSFHTPHKELKKMIFEGIDMYEQKRNALVLFENELIPYPFQKNFDKLSNSKIVSECRAGIPLTTSGSIPRNLEEKLRSQFGQGIFKYFLEPYNKKLWATPLDQISAGWTSQRIASLSKTEKFKESGGSRTPLQADTKVAYPAKGGFEEIWKFLATKIKQPSFETQCLEIDLQSKTCRTSNGHFTYNKLISTIPIDSLCRIITPCPKHIIDACGHLSSLSMILALILIDKPIDTDIQRIYSASHEILPHKTALNHNSSDYLRKKPQHGVMFEISTSKFKKINRKTLNEVIIDNLKQMTIIKSENEIKSIKIIDVPNAYPIQRIGMTQHLQIIKSFLEENNIFSEGRFGSWAYINSDEAFNRGYNLGRSLQNG